MFLYAYPNCWTTKEPREATAEFKADMNEINEKIKKRNEMIDAPYTYLMPSKIPSSITI